MEHGLTINSLLKILFKPVDITAGKKPSYLASAILKFRGPDRFNTYKI
jgi:hypothetical protein